MTKDQKTTMTIFMSKDEDMVDLFFTSILITSCGKIVHIDLLNTVCWSSSEISQTLLWTSKALEHI